jgi:isochorismate hydrolase
LNFSVILVSARNIEPVKISRVAINDKSADYARAEHINGARQNFSEQCATVFFTSPILKVWTPPTVNHTDFGE